MNAIPETQMRVVAADTHVPPTASGKGVKNRRSMWNNREKPNVLAGIMATLWLAIVAIPLYYIISTSFRTRPEYLTGTFLGLPVDPTLENYKTAWNSGFGRILWNTGVVTASTVAIVLILAIPAAYGIARNKGKFVSSGFSMLLLGLAIPAQAVIVPLYLMITKVNLYDSLPAIILPSAAFALPVAVLVLTSSLRDIPKELYEAMTLDGGTPAMLLRRLVLPLSRPSIMTVGVYTAIGAWNGFLFPLVFTQSPEKRVLTLGLWNFQGQFGMNFPALLAAVTMSGVPILMVYIFGRRHLISGITAGSSK